MVPPPDYKKFSHIVSHYLNIKCLRSLATISFLKNPKLKLRDIVIFLLLISSMTRQSLLTPTKTDYSDAHGNSEGAQQYKEKWIKIKHQRDENGNLKYPWDFEVVHGFSSRAICPQTILGLIILFKTWVEKILGRHKSRIDTTK